MILLILFFLIILTAFPLVSSKSVSDTLFMCITSVIPSLFPFAVISDILVEQRVNFKNPFYRIISRLFNISPCSASVFLPGFLCGYPIGGKMVADLYLKGAISEEEKDKLLIFFNNAGPGFIIGMVGGVFLKNIKAGVIIYISHILASITFGIFSSFIPIKTREKTYSNENKPLFTSILSRAIKNSMANMINITGVICFFASFISIIDLFYPESITGYKGFIYSLLEMTNGIRIISESDMIFRIKSALCAFVISFGGFSVFMQLKTFLTKIKTAPYFLSKMLCGIFAFIYCYFLISLIG